MQLWVKVRVFPPIEVNLSIPEKEHYKSKLIHKD